MMIIAFSGGNGKTYLKCDKKYSTAGEKSIDTVVSIMISFIFVTMTPTIFYY
jgi:hypothetical protein